MRSAQRRFVEAELPRRFPRARASSCAAVPPAASRKLDDANSQTSLNLRDTLHLRITSAGHATQEEDDDRVPVRCDGRRRQDISQQVMLITEYIMQILLHCGRLQSVISVREYLVKAVDEITKKA